VQLPLLAPAFVVSWLLVFVLSLGELGTSLMVSPPGQATLSMKIYNLMHYDATDSVAALSLVILVGRRCRIGGGGNGEETVAVDDVASAQVAIGLDGVSKVLDGNMVVREVTLDVFDGEALALVGTVR
jgi:hypothetical protein